MSRHITLAAFLVTVAVVVPAAWQAPEADIPTDGPALRPKQETLHVGDATIAVELDRGVMMSGGKLKVSLVGTADTPRKVALVVRALEDNGMGPERVENPPTEVARRRITVEAAPGGGKPTEVAFELRPRGMKPGRMEWYDVEVTPAGKRGADDDAADTTATVGAVVWGGNNLAMTLEAPASVPAGAESVVVKLHVKNTAKQAMDYVDVLLGGPRLDYNGMAGLQFYGEDNVEIERIEQADDESIAPGAERVFAYKVTPKQPGNLTLLAKASASILLDEKRNKYLYLSAMESIAIARPEPQPEPEPAVAGN